MKISRIYRGKKSNRINIDIDDEFCDDPDVLYLPPYVLHAANIDHQDIAYSDQQDHQREEKGLRLVQGNVLLVHNGTLSSIYDLEDRDHKFAVDFACRPRR